MQGMILRLQFRFSFLKMLSQASLRKPETGDRKQPPTPLPLSVIAAATTSPHPPRLYLSTFDSSLPRHTVGRRKPETGIGVIAVVKAFSSRLWIWVFYNTESNHGFASNTSYFTVVLDCASSGTRVYVYEWMLKAVATTNSNRNLEFPILLHTFPDNLTEIDHHKDGCAYHCMQTEPGLDKFVGNAYGIEKSLEPLIRRAEKWVPYEKHQDTPIFVLATAGLRRLNKEIARGVLDDIENVVKLHEFKVRKDWIRVFSGEEEAYYGWIALNHHMGKKSRPDLAIHEEFTSLNVNFMNHSK
ncbi:hypothetical protein R6Q59_022178 [Mikania micrantha]